MKDSYIIPIICKITVKKNPNPHPIAAVRRRPLSISILAEYSAEEYNNSDVIRRIIAVTASHKLRSDNDSGKIIKSSPK
jgi:hypothetical protein